MCISQVLNRVGGTEKAIRLRVSGHRAYSFYFYGLTDARTSSDCDVKNSEGHRHKVAKETFLISGGKETRKICDRSTKAKKLQSRLQHAVQA